MEMEFTHLYISILLEHINQMHIEGTTERDH